jgi:hypothetical protein
VNGKAIGALAIAVALFSAASGFGLLARASAFQAWAIRQPAARRWNPFFARMQTRAYRVELRALGGLMLAMGALVLWTAATRR